MKFNPKIHHRRSIRLKGYDYSQAGLYFITICLEGRQCLFGKIENGEMMLNDAGKVANQCWLEIPNHFPDSVLHEHIIMPNHVHGIIELTRTDESSASGPKKENKFQKMIPRSIGSIVKGYKIGVTKWFRNTMPDDFPRERQIWQRNYYEHIIRDEGAYERISNYIINNPLKWKGDKFFQ